MRNSQFLDIVKLWAVVELLNKFSGDGGGGGWNFTQQLQNLSYF